jgi:hypothetical protein
VVLVALGLHVAAVPFPVFGHGWTRLDAKACPLEVLPELRAGEPSGPGGTPVFNEMIFAGFLIYFTPDLRVFIDDRCELYGDSWLELYADAALHHPERIEEWAGQYGFQRALVQPGSQFDAYLESATGWAVERRTDTAVLYRRVAPRPAGESGRCSL